MSFARFVLSYCGCGLLPKVPGTWGTAGAALTAWALLTWWPGAQHDWMLLCLGWVALASALTVILAPILIQEDGLTDPQTIVMDEVAGYWMTLAFARRPDVTTLVVAFFLFRFLDVVKPWPANRFESLPAGWGVLCDDLMAGLYGAAVLLGLDLLIRVA